MGHRNGTLFPCSLSLSLQKASGHDLLCPSMLFSVVSRGIQTLSFTFPFQCGFMFFPSVPFLFVLPPAHVQLSSLFCPFSVPFCFVASLPLKDLPNTVLMLHLCCLHSPFRQGQVNGKVSTLKAFLHYLREFNSLSTPYIYIILTKASPTPTQDNFFTKCFLLLSVYGASP